MIHMSGSHAKPLGFTERVNQKRQTNGVRPPGEGYEDGGIRLEKRIRAVCAMKLVEKTLQLVNEDVGRFIAVLVVLNIDLNPGLQRGCVQVFLAIGDFGVSVDVQFDGVF